MSADASNLSSSLATGPAAVPATLAGVIRKAAQATGASFDYLLTAAKAESNLDPKRVEKNSSATGLFQFIEQTWLGTMRQSGKALGYGRYADAIRQTPSGQYVVKDAQLRGQVLALRKDPAAAAAMGGAFTQQNAVQLARGIGRKPSDAELYMAHFFGAGAAAKVINLTGNSPQTNAAALFPAAARANPSMFYDKSGRARSIAGVYAELSRRYQVARASTTNAPTIAAAATVPASVSPVRRVAPTQDTAAATTAYAGAAGSQPQIEVAGRAEPVFHSLFHSDERGGPVARAVADFWGVGAERAGTKGAQTPSVPARPAASRPPASVAPLELFQESRPNVRSLFDGKI